MEQRLARGQSRTGQRQNVMTEPLGERAHVAGQFIRLRFSLMRLPERGSEVASTPPRAGAIDPGFELLAPCAGSPGELAQCIGERLALVLDVKHIAVTGRVAPGGFLSGPQTLARIGNRVVGSEPLP